MRKNFLIHSLILIVAIGALSRIWAPALWAYSVVLPLYLLGLYDILQKRHTLIKNFPIVGRGRYLMEFLRPKIYQYFVESDIDGTPFSRIFRSIIYQRAKKDVSSSPFGTQLDVYAVGYEWINHSLGAVDHHSLDLAPRVLFGGPACQKKYSASLLNVSAMSFGALSHRAILSLNGGAKLGNFAHNTGEGGLSPFHLEMGGDLIWQIGTGYFSCRTKEGRFDSGMFKDRAQLENVKMLEIKLSQGAKPGHGGILPAAKNTEQIAQIRGVLPHTDVLSPPTHTAFSNPIEMMHFVQKLRELSGGKPVGFKLCIGHKSEFLAICKAMISTGIQPDFITVDGGEGGTGAAPLEFSNSVGTPLIEGLTFVHDALTGFDLKKNIRIIAAGKVVTGFHIVKMLALGADTCNAARAMMMALGCIQALECHKNTCPTGVATQDPYLAAGLDVNDKRYRVYNFQRETVQAAMELVAAAGLDSQNKLRRHHIYKRVSTRKVMRYDEIHPYLSRGSLLKAPYPSEFKHYMDGAQDNTFAMQVPDQSL